MHKVDLNDAFIYNYSVTYNEKTQTSNLEIEIECYRLSKIIFYNVLGIKDLGSRSIESLAEGRKNKFYYDCISNYYEEDYVLNVDLPFSTFSFFNDDIESFIIIAERYEIIYLP